MSKRLTKSIRENIVDAIMQDIPRIDYAEKARTYVQEDALRSLPPKIKEVYDDEKLRSYIAEGTVYLRGFGGVRVATDRYVLTEEAGRIVREYTDAHEEQARNRRNMRNTLLGLFNAVTTFDQALKKLPEFAVYIKRFDTSPTFDATNLPVANIIPQLAELGWKQPEDKQ